MGKSWKNPHKVANAQKKSAVFTKLAREIQIAAKLGGPDPDGNARLFAAIEAARKASCPKDTIDRALKKGAGLLDDGSIIEEVSYEGYGPHGVGIIVECQTDNKNRTASEIRFIFKKNGGVLGETGSVVWMFNRCGLIEGTKEGDFDPEEEAIEAGADEVSEQEGTYSFYSSFEGLDEVRKNLVTRGWKIETCEPSYQPSNKTEINEEQRAEVNVLMEQLDDNEDSFRIYASLDF